MEKKSIFNELTGIRAIAAYMVFFHHYVFFIKDKINVFTFNFLSELHIGVTLFFVLSGFLIAYRYYDNVKIRDNKWIVKYIQNRVARVYPMYFILTCVAFFFIFSYSENLKRDVGIFFLNITFLRGFFYEFLFTGVQQGWSLTVEECFYFSAPIIFIFTKHRKILIPIISIFLLGIIGWLVFKNFYFYGLFSPLRFTLLYTFFGRVFEFFIGIVLALTYRKSATFLFFKNKYLWKTLLGSLGIVATIILLGMVKGDVKYGLWTSWGIVLNNWILPCFIALFYAGLITENSWLKKILATKLLVLLGKSSYSFYLLHYGVFYMLISKYISKDIIVLFVLINLLSIAFFYLVEEPLNNKIRKMNWYDFLSSKKKLFLKNKISTN